MRQDGALEFICREFITLENLFDHWGLEAGFDSFVEIVGSEGLSDDMQDLFLELVLINIIFTQVDLESLVASYDESEASDLAITRHFD